MITSIGIRNQHYHILQKKNQIKTQYSSELKASPSPNMKRTYKPFNAKKRKGSMISNHKDSQPMIPTTKTSEIIHTKQVTIFQYQSNINVKKYIFYQECLIPTEELSRKIAKGGGTSNLAPPTSRPNHHLKTSTKKTSN